MRILFLTVCLSVISFAAQGQRNSDWGVMAGVTTYLGDINPDGLFRTPGVGGALFHRYNFHPRHSLRTSLMAANIRGSDAAAGNAFQAARGESFSGFIGEIATQFEFNFFPYSTLGRKGDYTPYLAGGLGISFVSTGEVAFVPVIPFAAGIKINIHKNFGLEVEYGFRKTFYDNFDGLIDPVDPGHHAWTHNNDWYTFAGVAFTWKMFNRLIGCPAFEEEKNYMRRRR